MSPPDLPKPDFRKPNSSKKKEEQIACEPHPKGVVLPVRAHAGAKRQGVTSTREGVICISVTVAPEQGKANKAIGKVLAKILGVAASRVELVAGATSRQKRFFVEGLTVEEVQAVLQDGLRKMQGG